MVVEERPLSLGQEQERLGVNTRFEPSGSWNVRVVMHGGPERLLTVRRAQPVVNVVDLMEDKMGLSQTHSL